MVHESSPGDPDVIVIGAGPGGLAVAACLQQNGVRALVVDRAPHVGHTWRGHYDRLRLHTPRELSGLPGLPIPRRFGRWVARDDVVRYLEMYAAHHRLDLRLGVGVDRLDREGSRWRVHLADGTVLSAAHVVLATGYNNTPVAPDWPGLPDFTGEVVHASAYRTGAVYAGRDVLVVGAGNTGAEIAVDLVEQGAARVRLAIRTTPHILRRSTLGWPAQGTGILIRHLPPALVDRVAAVLEKVETPDLSEQGLARPDTGLYAQALRGRIPIQDVGIVDAIRSGHVEVVAAVTGMEGADVTLGDGTRIRPEVVVVATGYERGLEPLLGHLGVLAEDGRPSVHGARTHPAAPGLWFTGFTNPISGMFRELAIDARRIARAIARQGT
ncbi:MAG: NAD(P)/FAD-dependent oxidoreductase [Actinobacteria bacterium]|jgi:Predicted flavoprotein involved in K+ transport|nr:NAD(P)/FAD-dependent oxidoreductase [Actinomycetota bacterium]